ncbi:putative ribonuclease H-like domain-containing protein [Tanacetum coccineum]
MSTPATAEEKTNKKNDVKARGLLLMALPNEYQLTFSQHPDAKSMFAAIETRFGGNAATKKTQKTLLKQQYENFHYMNKPEVETMSIDDLYNNFKIVEQKVKKTVGTSSGGQNLAFMTAPSSSNTNDANIAYPQVSAASPSVNAASCVSLSTLVMQVPLHIEISAMQGKPQHDDKGFVNSRCSRHMTGNIAYLSDFKQFDGGYVAFRGGEYGGKITGKGTLKTDNLDFEDFPDKNQILLKIPKKDNMYSFDIKNIVPKESLTCLVAKATLDESMLWHRRLSHINFKNINKLVKDNLVRVLPTKHFENDQTCVACLKGKQHRASCKSKVLNPITKPLFMLHMDLFGPTFVSSLMHKKYCLVVTNDYSRFTWVFFLTTKDETIEILKNFIKEIENLVDKKVKTIRSDNETEFKNKVRDDFCREKVDSKLRTTFWAEAVSTACYVQNRVLVLLLVAFICDYWFLAQNHALLSNPLTSGLCWWLPP